MTPRARASAAAHAAAVAAAVVAAALPGAAPAQVDDIPYLDSPGNVTLAMLELAGVGPRDHVIDLGSGDGRIVITAAKRFGASGLGVEIVPQLVARSRTYAQQAGVADRAEFREQDLFTTDLARATVVTLYLLPEINLKLRPRLLALAPGTRVVSHDWDMGDWLPDRTRTVPVPDKAVGREKLSRVHLWVVPAPVGGRGCGAGGRTLTLAQQHQFLPHGQARVGRHDDAQAWSVQGRVEGATAQLWGAAGARMTLAWGPSEAPPQAGATASSVPGGRAGGAAAAATPAPTLPPAARPPMSATPAVVADSRMLRVVAAEGAWQDWRGAVLGACEPLPTMDPASPAAPANASTSTPAPGVPATPAEPAAQAPLSAPVPGTARIPAPPTPATRR